jgi:GntR family transcriptional regulator
MVRSRQTPSARVEQDLRARIEASEWATDEQLPTVAALAEHYGVARATVVAAERRIEADGLIEIVPNWGVFRR